MAYPERSARTTMTETDIMGVPTRTSSSVPICPTTQTTQAILDVHQVLFLQLEVRTPSEKGHDGSSFAQTWACYCPLQWVRQMTARSARAMLTAVIEQEMTCCQVQWKGNHIIDVDSMDWSMEVLSSCDFSSFTSADLSTSLGTLL
jgi:hypothetical protein